MFDPDFYPTPRAVARKMLQGIEKIDERTILEPSAGKGDLADAIRSCVQGAHGWNSQPTNIYCLESNVELRMILAEKGYKVVGDDFLTYRKNHLFDLIVMNPPFSEGAAHLLKAWEVLNGGEIVCLLNSETLRNRHTRDRELLGRIVDAHGTVEELGDVFAKAERKTGVEVVLVRLRKDKPDVTFDFFEEKTKEAAINPEGFDGGNLPAMRDTFGNLEIAYNEARTAAASIAQAKGKLLFYLKALSVDDGRLDDIVKEKTFNGMIDEIKTRAWDSLFSRSKISEVMTEKVRRDFDEFRRLNGGMDFTKENMNQLFETLFLNRGEIMRQCVLDAFDKLTAYDKKNKVHVEGWKTNDAWKVNRRVIIPWGAERRIGLDKPGINYHRNQELADVEKALCFLSGEKFEGYHSNIWRRVDQGGFDWGEWVETRFFSVKLFKKGTIHLQFLDDRLLEKFNISAARFKNWLPDDYNERERGEAAKQI